MDNDIKENGYEEWLRAEEDIKINNEKDLNKRKKEVRELVEYRGFSETNSGNFAGYALMEHNKNFSSSGLFNSGGAELEYTDLKQAYDVIPVIMEEDFKNIKQYKNVDEYKTQRERMDVKPLDKDEALRILYQENLRNEEESAALAFYHAQKLEKAKQKQEGFWTSLKQLQ